eukprot:3086339-Rhodomonas_salina.1
MERREQARHRRDMVLEQRNRLGNGLGPDTRRSVSTGRRTEKKQDVESERGTDEVGLGCAGA